MSFDVKFNNITYSFPKDLLEYVKLLDTVQEIENNLFSDFLSKSNKGNIAVIDTENMTPIFKEQAAIFIEKLCSKGIYDKTIDDYALNNEGFTEFGRINQNGLNAFGGFLADEISDYMAGMEQAEIDAVSQITGSGVRVFTSSALTLAASTALEYSILKKQANQADQQYRQSLEKLSEQGATKRENNERLYLAQHYYPEAKQAFNLFASVLLDKYLNDLVNADLFDKSAFDYINLQYSQSLLESLKISSSKEAILEKAFLACPFNPNVFFELANIGMLDADTYKTSQIFGINVALEEHISSKINSIVTDGEMSLSAKIQKATTLTPSICSVLSKDEQYYYKKIGLSFYTNAVKEYERIKDAINDKAICKNIVSEFGEGFFDNSYEYQTNIVNSYVRERIEKIISSEETELLVNKCGLTDFLDKIKPNNYNELLVKSNIDEYYINKLSQLICSLLPNLKDEHIVKKQKQQEYEATRNTMMKINKIVTTVLLVVLLVFPVMLNLVLVSNWEANAKAYVSNLIEEKISTHLKNDPDGFDEIGGISQYDVQEIEIYKKSGSFYIVPFVEYRINNNDVSKLTVSLELSGLAEDYVYADIKVPFYISLGSNSGNQIWGEGKAISPNGDYNYFSTLPSSVKKDSKQIHYVCSTQFLWLYALYAIILLLYYRKIYVNKYDLELCVKNDDVRKKVQKLYLKLSSIDKTSLKNT